jgi:hypothetical protein
MLDLALQFLKDELNAYFATHTGSDKAVVEMSRVVDYTGKYVIDDDMVGLSIINIEEERNFESNLPEYGVVNGHHTVMEPELKVNLHVLFAANHRRYDAALKNISYVLTYFQSHPSFVVDEYPGLDPRIAKLVVELQSLTYEQLNQVWAFIGAKQLPSVIYKVRLVSLREDSPKGVQLPIVTISSNLRHQ